jgi:hypothetical protein
VYLRVTSSRLFQEATYSVGTAVIRFDERNGPTASDILLDLSPALSGDAEIKQSTRQATSDGS